MRSPVRLQQLLGPDEGVPSLPHSSGDVGARAGGVTCSFWDVCVAACAVVAYEIAVVAQTYPREILVQLWCHKLALWLLNYIREKC